MIGSGIGGLPGITEGAITLHERGPRRISPFFIPSNLINLASGHVSIRYGFKGPNHAVVTACSTGAHAIGDAARLIMLDDADVMVCGGTEAAVCRLGIAGFAAARALSTGFNDDPPRASRPWDQDRDGFVMGEGAGILVLEELEHAKQRGAKIYAEVIGYGMSGDAYHLTAPAEDGNGAFRSMRNALKRAGIAARQIDYINAHGTSTPLGDEIELGAVKRLFGEHAYKLSMSSTKSAIGHLLGAAGSVEAIFSILAMRDGVVPPTLNLDNPSPACDIDLVPKRPRSAGSSYVLSNSFGFGGTNASLIFAGPAVSRLSRARSPRSSASECAALLRLLGLGVLAVSAVIAAAGGAGCWLYRDAHRAGPADARRARVVIPPRTGLAGDRRAAGATTA